MNVVSVIRDNPLSGDGGMPDRTDDLIGRMCVGGKNLCKTVENTEFAIPPGCYPLERHDSERHPNTLHLVIPHWSNVLIHRGTLPPQSKACVLVPTVFEEWLRDHVLAGIDRGEVWWALIQEPPEKI